MLEVEQARESSTMYNMESSDITNECESSQSKTKPSINHILEQQLQMLNELIASDSRARKVIEIISSNKETAVNPIVNIEDNKVTYPLLSQIGDDGYVADLLEKLASPSFGILKKTIQERIPVCPKHPNHMYLIFRLYCPKCSSNDLTKLYLTEHKVCGYITEDLDLEIDSGNITKCKNCKNTIKKPEKEIRRVGRWHQCNSCGNKFDNYVLKLHCRQFSHDFDFNDAKMICIPSYKLNTDIKSLNALFSFLPEFEKLLATHGLTFETLSAVKGMTEQTMVSDGEVQI